MPTRMAGRTAVMASAAARCAGRRCFLRSAGRLFSHQPEAPGDGRQLQPHIRLIDGADVLQAAAQFPCDIRGIAAEVFHGAFRFPAAFPDEPHRAGEMHQRYDGLYAVFPAAADHVAVVLRLRPVKAAFFRLDARPLDGKAVGVETGQSLGLDSVRGEPTGLAE